MLNWTEFGPDGAPVKFAVPVPVRQFELVKLCASGVNESPTFDGVTTTLF